MKGECKLAEVDDYSPFQKTQVKHFCYLKLDAFAKPALCLDEYGKSKIVMWFPREKKLELKEVSKILKIAYMGGDYQTFNKNIEKWLSITPLARLLQPDVWVLGPQKTKIDIRIMECVLMSNAIQMPIKQTRTNIYSLNPLLKNDPIVQEVWKETLEEPIPIDL